MDGKTEVTAAQMLQNRYLNAAWKYYETHRRNPDAGIVSRLVFGLLGVGKFSTARDIAASNDQIKEIFEIATKEG